MLQRDAMNLNTKIHPYSRGAIIPSFITFLCDINSVTSAINVMFIYNSHSITGWIKINTFSLIKLSNLKCAVNVILLCDSQILKLK